MIPEPTTIPITLLLASADPSSGFALFNSYAFLLVFLPLTILGHRLALRFAGGRAAVAVLVLASLTFYGSWTPTGQWSPNFLIGLLASMAFNFTLGRALAARAHKDRARALLALGVAVTLAHLGWFKYVTFIHQLISVPIVHHFEMLPQFRENQHNRAWKPSSMDLSIGLTLLSFGLFKKVIIADEMAALATPIFNQAESGAEPYTPVAWTGALAYTFQIYFDFSAYSDMATGVARLFGIKLPTNFFSPYNARSIVDFWRRWHITLSRFLRDYLYIPLGGNRKGPARRYVNLAITMLLGGLWHGAAWTFVFWGALHGLYLCINHAWSALAKKWTERPGAKANPSRFGSALYTAACWGVTMLAVVVAWVFFRAPTFEGARAMLQSMFAFNLFNDADIDWTLPTDPRTTGITLAAGVLISLAPPNGLQLLGRFNPTIDWSQRANQRPWCKWSPDWFWAILAALLFAISFLHLSRPSEFIYWQF